MSKIKICGLFREDDIRFANAALPDYIGFVFAKTSRRNVSFIDAARLRDKLDGRVTPVGVFVNAGIEDILALFRNGVISAAQLHGDEDETDVLKLRSLKIPVIKATAVRRAEDVLNAARSSADYVLLDNGRGGTGAAFDWRLISGINKPYFIAGGVNAENTPRALALRPYGVDVSGGVETDGFKDEKKMMDIVRIVRDYNG
jgi:phosphoribosylanthranilate isomerase